MTATQAPTPGPLSVGDRVVAIADLRQAPNGAVWIKEGEEALIVREFGVNGCLVGVLTDEGHEGEWAKTCFRLALTAPVEASGSERENLKAALQRSKGWPHDLHPGPAADAAIAALHPQTSGETREHGPKCWGKTSASDEMAHCYCGSTDLRPQPSGETRPTDEEIRSAIKATEYKYFGDYEFTEDQHAAVDVLVRAAQVLLSARPLALGGQQGDSETLRVLLDNLVIAQTLSKDIRQKATDEACSYLYDRRTTPARAEAQDEGAAGDSAIALARRCTQTIAAQHGPDSDLANGARMVLAALICAPALDHPSPPPAADEDRVRIAVEALEKAVWSLGSFGQLAADEEGGNTEGLDDEVVVRMTFPDPEYGGEKTLLGEVFIRAFRKAKAATDECREALAALKSEGKA